MITQEKFEQAVQSKIGWLTKYYMNKYGFSTDKAYIYIRDTGIIDILKQRDNRLFLESVDMLVDAIDIYYIQGSEQMRSYLYQNIGG